MSETWLPAGIGAGIMVIDGLVPERLSEALYLFCLDAMDVIGNPGRTIGGLMENTKLTTDIRLSDMSAWRGEWHVDELRKIGYDMQDLDAQMSSVVFQALRTYADTYPIISQFNYKDTGYQMQRYKKGEGFYAEHVDGDPARCAERILALVIYLNDVDSGGGTYFRYQQATVQPQRGRVVIFPSTWLYPHEALVPVSDDKYMISTFIELQ